MSNIQGWLNVYKPLNISSFDVIRKLKKKFNIKKIGHGGTLDPLAEGILPIAIGKTTKLISFIEEHDKLMNPAVGRGAAYHYSSSIEVNESVSAIGISKDGVNGSTDDFNKLKNLYEIFRNKQTTHIARKVLLRNSNNNVSKILFNRKFFK